MRLSTLFITGILSISLIAVGCGGDGTNSNASNANVTNANVSTAVNSNNPVAVSTPVTEQTTNNAPTLAPVFKAYCEAMEKKDEAGIRKVYSKDTLEAISEDMKSEGSKTLVEYLSTDNVTTALCEIRNESISGNEAVAEVTTAGMPKGAKIVFIKEGNEWKITNRSPSLDAVKQTATNSNAAK